MKMRYPNNRKELKECFANFLFRILSLITGLRFFLGVFFLGEEQLYILLCFFNTVGKNKKKIQEYIRNQLQQDQIADQLSLKEFVDPFTGSKETKA